MTARDFSKENRRKLIAARGTESARDDDPTFMAPLLRRQTPRPRQLSKAELREQLAAAMAETARRARDGR